MISNTSKTVIMLTFVYLAQGCNTTNTNTQQVQIIVKESRENNSYDKTSEPEKSVATYTPAPALGAKLKPELKRGFDFSFYGFKQVDVENIEAQIVSFRLCRHLKLVKTSKLQTRYRCVTQESTMKLKNFIVQALRDGNKKFSLNLKENYLDFKNSNIEF
jgi:hypothetical protein